MRSLDCPKIGSTTKIAHKILIMSWMLPYHMIYVVFGMCHVGCKSILHDHVFWTCGMLFQSHRKLLFNIFGKLQFRIVEGRKWLKTWHKKKHQIFCATHSIILHSLGARLHHTQTCLVWHCWAQNSWSMAYTTITWYSLYFSIDFQNVSPLKAANHPGYQTLENKTLKKRKKKKEKRKLQMRAIDLYFCLAKLSTQHYVLWVP